MDAQSLKWMIAAQMRDRAQRSNAASGCECARFFFGLKTVKLFQLISLCTETGLRGVWFPTMTTILENLVDRKSFLGFIKHGFSSDSISIITVDGRLFVGSLKGFDQSTNVILSSCVERVFTEDSGVEFVQLGLYLIRGDNM